jgi:putative ABC transport system ATP-binding protein
VSATSLPVRDARPDCVLRAQDVHYSIALPLLLGGTRRRAAYATAATWLGRLGLDGLGTRRTGELSGGQAQRVAVARALVGRPQVLFADEPTGALDSLTGEKVMDLLVDLVRAEGTTVVLVTHDARVAAYADREAVVRDGKVTTPSDAVVAE